MDRNEYKLSDNAKVVFSEDGFVKFIDTGDSKEEVWLTHTEYHNLIDIIRIRMRTANQIDSTPYGAKSEICGIVNKVIR